MRFEVEFTPGARQDLLKIYRYIKADGRPEAAKVVLFERIKGSMILCFSFHKGL